MWVLNFSGLSCISSAQKITLVFQAIHVAMEPAMTLLARGLPRSSRARCAAQSRMAPSRALQLICRAGAAAPPCTALSRQLAGFQGAGATPASAIQAPAMHFVPPREMPDVGGGKNVCNRARSLNQNLTQRSKVSHFVRSTISASLSRQCQSARSTAAGRPRSAPDPRTRQSSSSLRTRATVACSMARSHDCRNQSRR